MNFLIRPYISSINFVLFTAFVLLPAITFAQIDNQSGFERSQKLNSVLYNPATRYHTGWRPLLFSDSLLKRTGDSVNTANTDIIRKTWLGRKVFNEHLIQVDKPDYNFYADFLPDLQIGRDVETSKGTWLNTRGFQIGGSIGNKFSFYTSGFENQGRFADYYSALIDKTTIVPGQAYNRNQASQKITKDWSYVTALISYTPNKYLNVAVGNDKNFVGDGYRSMLLSDVSAPYTFLRLIGTLGNVRYTVMYAALQDPSALRLSFDGAYRKKGAVFHYLDWNVNNRLSLGFFDAVVWAQRDDLGQKRGFDWSYINPIVFLRPLEANTGSPDNAVIGFTAKYEISKELVGYGQFALDELEGKTFFSSVGSARTKFGLQLGIKGSDVFKIDRLNYLLEYNTAKPYTYSERFSVINYANFNEPLAHPLGANFRELVSIVNYSYRKFDFTGQLLYAKYGLDAPDKNSGKDIFQPYPNQYVPNNGNYTTQGIRTNLYFAEAKVAYVLNPTYNLRVEVSGLYRRESNNITQSNTGLFTIALRSSFRNLYHDF